MVYRNLLAAFAFYLGAIVALAEALHWSIPCLGFGLGAVCTARALRRGASASHRRTSDLD